MVVSLLNHGFVSSTLDCFCTISALSLYGEYVVRSFLPNGVFLPCDHGLDFLHQLIGEFDRSKSIKRVIFFSDSIRESVGKFNHLLTRCVR